MSAIAVLEYTTADGKCPIGRWLDRLSDRRARARIVARIDRLRAGLRGDWKPLGAGVFELRVDEGPGYRIYCGQCGLDAVLLLCGGDKRTQERDTEVAHAYWKEHQERRSEPALQGGRIPSR